MATPDSGPGGPHSDAPVGMHPDAPTGGNPDAPQQVAGHLVINEVDYDQVGTDLAEFVEIYNPTSSAQNLSGLALVFVNGSNNSVYASLDMTSMSSLPAGGYLVFAGPNVTVAGGALSNNPGWTQDAIQNGAPDGMALVDVGSQTLLDAIAYEGAMTNVQLTGFSGTSSLVEGTPTGVSDSNTAAGSLCRMPDGADTDNATVDWAFCANASPGAANY
jgi:hypothetical protein